MRRHPPAAGAVNRPDRFAPHSFGGASDGKTYRPLSQVLPLPSGVCLLKPGRSDQAAYLYRRRIARGRSLREKPLPAPGAIGIRPEMGAESTAMSLLKTLWITSRKSAERAEELSTTSEKRHRCAIRSRSRGRAHFGEAAGRTSARSDLISACLTLLAVPLRRFDVRRVRSTSASPPSKSASASASINCRPRLRPLRESNAISPLERVSFRR